MLYKLESGACLVLSENVIIFFSLAHKFSHVELQREWLERKVHKAIFICIIGKEMHDG